MKVSLMQVGKSPQKAVVELFGFYQKRLKPYTKLEIIEIAELKGVGSFSAEERKLQEGQRMLAKLQSSDYVILLDEKGAQLSSVKFAQKWQQTLNSGPKHVVFIVGGAYGFSPEVYQRAQWKWALSPMTFPHDLVRVIFIEQLYRAFSILNNQPYHHE